LGNLNYNKVAAMFVGRIYRIWAPGVERCYVGSTRRRLCNRLASHKFKMRVWQSGNPQAQWCSSYQILEHEGAQIDLIEEEEFGDEMELLEREKYWMERLPTVNHKRPVQTRTERVQQKAESNHRRNQVREPCPLCGRVGLKKHHQRHMSLMHTSSPAQI
jgi:hypothetical protein